MNNRPKKIFDIFPPEIPPDFELELPAKKLPAKKLPTPKNLGSKKGLILALVVLILAGIFSYFLLPRVQIEIWPETQTLNFKEKVEVSSKVSQPDFLAKLIPGEIFEVSQEASQEFPASGRVLKEEKARGQIRVYNAYSTSTQVLVANTRFISAEGKLFRSVERVTIPGGEYEKGKLVPGFLDIQVLAAEPGEDYNIKPSTFSIPGFAGTPRYTAFYGKSFSAMTGGFRGEISQVAKEDLDNAKNILVARLFEESKKVLKNKIPLDSVLLKEAQIQEISHTFSSVQAGEEAQSFNFQVKVYSKALAFKESDLENFAKESILSQTPQDISEADSFWLKKKLQPESLRINYKAELIDLQLEKIILNLEFSAKIYSDLNQSVLKKALSGKPLKESRILLENQPQISKVQVKFWPFWIKKAPQREEKIKIKLNLEG